MAKSSSAVSKKKSVRSKKKSPASSSAKAKSGSRAKKSASQIDVEARHNLDLKEESKLLESLSPDQRIKWLLEKFDGKIAMSSSFGAQSAVTLHLMTQHFPEIPVILVDTGYLFTETYQFIEELTDRLNLNLKIYSNPLTPAWQEAKFGKLWEKGIDGIEQYNTMNKVEPMNRALEDLNVEVLVSGLRRQQSSTRQNMPVLVSQRGRLKFHPIIEWTDKDIGMYLHEHDLPYHPLWEAGYMSIGDWHTSRKLTDGMTEEESRFMGLKRECGLHEEVDFQI